MSKSEKAYSGTLVDQILVMLEEAIQNGELTPGKKISELSLSSVLGVSRGPLREAIRHLEARRIFERTAFQGVRLVDLSTGDLEQLLVVREVLEGAAARSAAENMTDSEIAELQVYAQELPLPGRPFTPGSSDSFHQFIAAGSKNRWLVEILCKDLYGLLRIYQYGSVDYDARAREAHQEHLKIVAAIASRDGERAETLMRAHNRNGRKILLERLRSEQGKQPSLRRIARKNASS